MLKFCDLDQISFLDEVVTGAWTMCRPLYLRNNPYVPFFNKIRRATEIKYGIYGIYSEISSIIGFHC
jgi:hypothetical protein